MEKLSFKDSMNRLDEIVSQLESKDLELENAITLFEEGLTLVKKCDEQLNTFEKKVNSLIDTYQGDE